MPTSLHNLSSRLTRFVGRAAELADIEAELGASRLVTLVGPGGVGKTRLALEAAARRVAAHGDGVSLVELAGIDDADQVVDALAAALGVREEAGHSLADCITQFLAERDTLIVLDNCEHLIAAAAAASELALRAGEGVRVLATSRQALGASGERVWPVPTMSEAVALFVDRAGNVSPHSNLGAAEHAAIAEICRQLDGLPLAIELAAALVDRLSVQVIADRLPERFELLTKGSRTAPARQRSLSAAIDWSYELLGPAAQRTLARVSVFPDGFDIAGAEALAGSDALAAVSELVSASLVVHASGRYSMLETMRAYATERLAGSGEVGAIHDRLVDWATTVIDAGDLERLELERANVLAGLRWQMNRSPDDALALATGLGEFWEQRGHWSEGRRVLRDALAYAGGENNAFRARALYITGRLAFSQGDFDDADALLRESLAMAEELDIDELIYRTLTDLGGLAHMRGDIDDARLHFDAALAIGRAANNDEWIGPTLGNLGILAHATGDLAAAVAHYADALAVARRAGEPAFLIGMLINDGMVREMLGDRDSATAEYREALDLARAANSSVNAASALAHLGGRDQLEEALGIFRDVGDRPNVANVLYRLGEMASKGGDYDDAAALLQESIEVWRELGHALGEAAVRLSIGAVERRRGHVADAVEHFHVALASLQQLQSRAGVAAALDQLGAVAADRADYERAAELLCASEAMYARMGAPTPPLEDRPLDPMVVRQALGDDAFRRAEERGSALDDEAAAALGLATSG